MTNSQIIFLIQFRRFSNLYRIWLNHYLLININICIKDIENRHEKV